MQVILQPLPSGTQIPLTGPKPTESVSGFVLQHARLVEQIARVRADAAKFRSRRNRSHSLQFAIHREHADEGIAALFCMTHAQSLPDACNVIFRVQRFNGVVAAELRLTEAIVIANQGDWQGCATTFTYTVHGGQFEI
jgi:hypothetical protein